MDYAVLKDTILKLKKQIIKTEAGDAKLTETDTRQGLINPLFRALQWDFTDFDSIKSEPRVPEFNEPVDYAFYSSKKKSAKPILLLEAKRLGSNIGHKNHVKQLTSYLGAMGVQWGVLSDGNRYVLYNSRGGKSFEEQKFLTLEIKTVDTDSGFTMDEFLKHLTSLLSRECLENEEIQHAYEEHMIHSRIKLALDSLLSTPFDTLCKAIQREFKEERVGLPDGIKISMKHIKAYVESISDEAGRIPVDLDTAVRLARYFRTTPQVWLNLQKTHEMRRAEIAVGHRIAAYVKPWCTRQRRPAVAGSGQSRVDAGGRSGRVTTATPRSVSAPDVLRGNGSR